ncbi:target of rapamycin complex subunit lst8-like [Xenia sp. Carnegie-2017]|uniref:target of rapamycin complex subunit lst8-like n=1 Tax=Xenia sp. Carnegie-2017 TaxID=2897299 RepID=UPI001F03DFD3|nr:target of rapamycin complex subunit lst8-like [Xenia sp. Carnegie-2017]
MGNEEYGNEKVILATAGYDHSIRFWQAHNGVSHRTVPHSDSQINDMAITPDRRHLAAAGYQHIKMYDIKTSNINPILNYDGISKNTTSVGFQEDGKWMFTGGEDCSARIWDLRSRNLQCQRVYQAKSAVNCVVLHPNQSELIVGDDSGAIHVWDLRTDRSEKLIPEAEAAVLSLSINEDATYMAAINNQGNCYVWSLSSGTTTEPTVLRPRSKLVKAHEKAGLKCLFSPDSCLLATTSADQSIKIWRTSDFTLKSTLKDDEQRWVWDCDFSDDSQYLVTVSSDAIGRLWSLEQEEVVRKYKGHQKALVSLAFKDVRID